MDNCPHVTGVAQEGPNPWQHKPLKTKPPAPSPPLSGFFLLLVLTGRIGEYPTRRAMDTTVSLSPPPLSPLLRRTNLKPTSLKPLSTNPNLSFSFTQLTLCKCKPRFTTPVRVSNAESGWERRTIRFKNRLLDLTRLGSVVETAAESFFKSEIRRRLAVTAALIVLSRIGYFIPLPGFDRRLIPNSYLSFASGAADNLGDFTAELKLSLFQLGISHQISASILMQVLCHIIPSLIKLRKEGLDGQEKIKSYMCV